MGILDSCGKPGNGPLKMFTVTPGTRGVQDDKRDIGRYDYIVNWEMGTLRWAFGGEAGVDQKDGNS